MTLKQFLLDGVSGTAMHNAQFPWKPPPKRMNPTFAPRKVGKNQYVLDEATPWMEFDVSITYLDGRTA